MTIDPDLLRQQVADAVAARRSQPLGAVADALAAAAVRWAADPRLLELEETCRFTPEMIAAITPRITRALSADALHRLVTQEFGPGALAAPAPAGPTLVGHVVASNVPALALPAIVHALLVGAAVVVKSGRDDHVSAVAFQEALAGVDAALARTVVTTAWAGGDVASEQAAFATADVLVGTGRSATIDALADRATQRFVGHGDRESVVLVCRDEALPLDELAARIALDAALYEQRGCLSPHTVLVEAADADTLGRLADALAVQLDAVAERIPCGPASVAERAVVRTASDEIEWTSGGRVVRADGGMVLIDPRPGLHPPIGHRTLRVQAIAHLHELHALLPVDRIECVAIAGDATAVLPTLQRLGVSRVCPPGRMQEPPIHWPRGQHPPLGALRGPVGRGTMLVES